MSKWINNIQIKSTEGLPDLERIDQQLKALILSAEGTIPGSRGFGLSREFISMSPREALNLLMIELEEKVEEYIPEITIADIDGEFDMDGILRADIYVERRI
mgnify:CR=1 FL=1